MLTLITLTGDRQWAFSLCEKYMARQTVGWGNWLVIDDGHEPTVTTLDQQVIRLSPGLPPKESFRRNMQVALSHGGSVPRGDKILFIEDDDWYSRWHIELMNAQLDNCVLAGEGRAKYYNVKQRKFLVHPNNAHASLCQTGFKGDDIRRLALSYLTTASAPEMLDGHIWKRAGVVDTIKRLNPTSTTTVGIKGAPGRGGLGGHHVELPPQYRDDADASVLKLWLAEDAHHYEGYYANN